LLAAAAHWRATTAAVDIGLGAVFDAIGDGTATANVRNADGALAVFRRGARSTSAAECPSLPPAEYQSQRRLPVSCTLQSLWQPHRNKPQAH
jgi:hypothetical protein